MIYGPFYSMGRFGHIENLWAILVGAVLVHGPFWYRPVNRTCLAQRPFLLNRIVVH